MQFFTEPRTNLPLNQRETYPDDEETRWIQRVSINKVKRGMYEACKKVSQIVTCTKYYVGR